jgi:phosphonoacetate hydrolase
MRKRIIMANSREYAWPTTPIVVVCIDGSEPGYEGSDNGGYIDLAMTQGVMPFLSGVIERGTFRTGDCVVPSFTNPNNLSIITGRPPAVHGICGNFFYDPVADVEVMMNEPELLRAETIFKAFEDVDARVAVVTAKDKLRRLLGHRLRYGEGGAICFSAEKANQTTLARHGIENVPDLVNMAVPAVYSAELSEFVLAAGVKLMKTIRPDIMYLSTTDYIQHKHAPGSERANDFYAMVDRYLSQIDALGVVLAITADHGMKAKHDTDGNPNVIYLQPLLDQWIGVGRARVILPITDPNVVHHGALGGFATSYLPEDVNVSDILEKLRGVEGIGLALTRSEGCERFELPADRMGDIIVISNSNWVIGSAQERHDLSGLTEPLRSHGGLSEQRIPFILNRPTPDLPAARRLRNFDIFDVALNYAQ